MQYCFKGFNCLKTLNARVYRAHGEQQQTRLCGCYDLQRAQRLARKEGLCQHLEDVECAVRILTVCVLFSFINGSNDVHINCRRYLRAFL